MTQRFSPAMLTLGAFCVLMAALWTNAGIESALNRSAGSLMWGPALFRALLALHGILLIGFAFQRKLAGPASTALAPVGRKVWWLLAAMSSVALGLRLWRLDTGLWFDEVLTLVGFVRMPASQIVSSFPDQNQHMLFSLLSHASVQAFGEHAWSLRLPSVFFGVLSIWALFLLGRRILGVREALLACALMTVSYHHIWFSQNARGYMGLLFFSILSVWIWLEALERRRTGWWVAFGASVALGIWAHLTMVFVAAAIALVYLAGLLRRDSMERRASWGPGLAMLLAGTLALQLHALTVPEFFRTALGEVSVPSEWTNPLWVVSESLRSLNIGLAGAGVMLFGGVFLLIGWKRLAVRNPRAMSIMTLAPLLGGALMLAASHNLWPRFFFFAMGFALLMAIGGVMDVTGLLARTLWKPHPERGSFAGVAVCTLLICASALTVPRVYRLPKQDFAGARDYAERLGKPGVPVAAVGLAGVAYEKYYAPHWESPKTGDELAILLQRYSGITLVYTLPIELKAFHPDVWRVVEANFATVATFPGTLGGGEVYVSQPRLSPQSATQIPAGFQR